MGILLHPDSSPLQGIYLPVWWFSFGGQVNYRYYMDKDDKQEKIPEGIDPG